jgi:octaprenyl-diphosphate synthase
MLANKLLNPFPTPQQGLNDVLTTHLQQVDQVIDTYLKSDIPLIDQIAKHLIHAGGKRIRPCLTLGSAMLFGDVTPEVNYLAAAVEFIHTATLLHDDVIDESDTRRGLQSAHRIWGNTASILVGDFLFARAFELMVQTNEFPVLQILSHASATIAAGEVHQFSETHNLDITEETILKILGAKTAQLFGAACQTGALVAGATEEDAKKMFDYGYNLGLVFQITDDVLDYLGSDSGRGKLNGDDFREGKITLPMIYTYQKANAAERQFFKRTMVDNEQTPDDFNQAVALIRHYNGFEDTLKKAAAFRDKAIDNLENIYIQDKSYFMRDLLIKTACHCLERDF